MGSVFLAEQVGVGNRLVALKILQRNLLDDPKFVERFHSEASSAGRIRHSNVVTIYESGQETDGTPYIAMEYLEGESLGQRLRAHGPLPISGAVEIVEQTARGLNAAHRLGIIHRDLKPDNIFLARDDDGRLLVKVVDFGIAKLRESSVHTQTGGFLGTPAYMSFEQASGMRSDSLDARSDIYSLGIVAYEMLSGRLPFESDTSLGFVRQHLTEDPAPLRERSPGLDVPPALEQVIMKALSKRREDRQASALEFAREFGAAAGIAPRPTPAESQWSTGFDLASGFPRSGTPSPPPSPDPSAARWHSQPDALAPASRGVDAAVATPPPTPLPTPAQTPSRPTPARGQIGDAPGNTGFPDQATLDARAADIERALESERLRYPSPKERRYLRMQQRMQRLDRKLQGVDQESVRTRLKRHPLLVLLGVAIVLAILFSGGPKKERTAGPRPAPPEAPSTPPGASDQAGEHAGHPADNTNSSGGSEGLSSADNEEIRKKVDQGRVQAEKALRDALSNVPPAVGRLAKDLGVPIPPIPPSGAPPRGMMVLPSGVRIILQPLTPQSLGHPVKAGTVVGQQFVDGGLEIESADVASDIVTRTPHGEVITLLLLVNPEGRVYEGRSLGGDDSLAKEVIGEAKGHWHFSPPRAGGVPVRAKAGVTVQFP